MSEVRPTEPEEHGSVEPHLDGHGLLGTDRHPWGGSDLVPPVSEGDREIIPDHPRLLHGEHRIERRSLRPREDTVRISGTFRFHAEPFAVIGEELLGEESVRLGSVGDPSHPELRDEPVLERAEEPFHPSLRLGRPRVDDVDPELPHGSLELRREVRILRDLPAVRMPVRGESIDVYAERFPVRSDVRLPEGEDGDDPLVIDERRSGDAARRVINRREEAGLGGAILEPAVV